MSESATSPTLSRALTAAGGGAGLALGIAGIKTLSAHPEFLPQLLSGGALYFVVVVVGMVVVSRKADSFLSAHVRGVVANEMAAAANKQLAENVGALVAKDDTRAQALEAAMRYVAEDTRAILGLLRKPETTDGR